MIVMQFGGEFQHTEYAGTKPEMAEKLGKAFNHFRKNGFRTRKIGKDAFVSENVAIGSDGLMKVRTIETEVFIV